MTPEHLKAFMSLQDVDLLALTMFLEARSEPVEGIIAVGCNIRNRVQSGRFGGVVAPKGTYKGVILDPKDYSCFNENDKQFERALYMAMHPSEWPYDPRMVEIRYLAAGIRHEAIRDNSNGSTHYYNPKVCTPYWEPDMVETARIGRHRFMKEKSINL